MKTLKTTDCVTVYMLLKDSRLGKMETSAKINVIKSLKELKRVAEGFEAFRKDAQERLKGEDHEEMLKKAGEWNLYGDGAGLTDEEKREVNAYFERYGKAMEECVMEESEKEHELDIRTIDEEQMMMMINANDTLTVEQMEKLLEVML